MPSLRPPLLSCLLALAALGGCHKALRHPDLLTPAWDQPDPAADGALVASSGDGDRPVLEPDIVRAKALENHPSVHAAEAELAAAEAGVKTAGAWPNPELEGRVLLQGPEQGSLEAALTQTLPISGRTAAARNAARIELAMARVRLESARHEATLEADGLLAALAHERRHVALAREVAAASAQLSELVQQRQAAAMADPLDVSLILADAARDQGALASAEASLAAIEGRLGMLLGLEPGSYVILPPPFQRASLAEDASSLLSAAASSGPGWVLARLDLERAEWSAREASRARIPEPSLGPAVAGDPANPTLGLAFGLPLPILAPGQAAYKQAVAERDAAYQRLRGASREATTEIDTLLARHTSLERSLEALGGSTLRSARRAADLARERYQAGQLDLLLMLSAQRAWAQVETDYLDVLLAIRDTQLELERVVGRPLQLQTPPTELP